MARKDVRCIRGGDEMGKDNYRRDVEDLVAAQNRGLPICPHDGKPCSNPESGCEASAFGVMTRDGKNKAIWRCPRFKPNSVARFR